MRLAILAVSLLPSVVFAHAEIDEVLHALERDAAVHRSDPTIALQQAAAYRIAGDFDAALDAVAHAEEHGASTRDVILARSDIFLAAGWLRSARRHLDRLVAADPEDADARFRRARVLIRQGEAAAAARDYAAALAGAPRPRPEHFMEHRDALVAAGDPAGALAALDAGIARLGPLVSLEIPAAALALDLGRADDALARLDRLLKQAPENALLLARKGEILAHAGRTADAHDTYEKALAVLVARNAHRPSPRSQALEAQVRTALGATPKPSEE